MSYNTFEIVWRKIEAPIKFTGTVTLDAPVGSNLEGIAVVSQVLPLADRAIAFEGIISDTELLGSSTKLVSRKPTATECPNNATGFRLLSSVSF